MEIVGKSVVLKEFTEAHLIDETYFSWIRNINVINGIYRLDYLLNKTRNDIEEYVKSLLNSDNNCFFAVYTLQGNFIGTVKLGHIDWRTGVADVGIMIGDRGYWGKGLSKEIVFLMCYYGFNYLSLRKITGGCVAQNIAMSKCFESLGFSKEGIIRSQLLISGNYEDHLLYGCFKKELEQKFTPEFI